MEVGSNQSGWASRGWRHCALGLLARCCWWLGDPIWVCRRAHFKLCWWGAMRSWHSKHSFSPFGPSLGSLISPWALFFASPHKICSSCPLGSPRPHWWLCMAQASELEWIRFACTIFTCPVCVCVCSLKCANQRLSQFEFFTECSTWKQKTLTVS